jgi:hypothetical protein
MITVQSGNNTDIYAVTTTIWYEYKYYVYDAGAANDQLVPKVKLADLAKSASAGGSETKERDDGSFIYSNESMPGNDRSTEPGKALLALLKADICRMLSKMGEYGSSDWNRMLATLN